LKRARKPRGVAASGAIHFGLAWKGFSRVKRSVRSVTEKSDQRVGLWGGVGGSSLREMPILVVSHFLNRWGIQEFGHG